jgi:colanic acid/amylovoran biosynthesis protein
VAERIALKKLQVLVLNTHSIQNSGDAALLFMNLQQIRSGFGDVDFTIISNYPDEDIDEANLKVKIFPSPYHLIGTGLRKNEALQLFHFFWGLSLSIVFKMMPKKWRATFHNKWFELFRAFEHSDLVVSVSGNILLSLGNFSWPFLLSAWQIFLSILYSKPIYIMPQSLGPFRHTWERGLTRFLYSRARLVFIRDRVSYRLVKEMGIPDLKVKFSPDPAFTLPASEKNAGLQILKRSGFQENDLAIGATVIAQLTKALNKEVISTYQKAFAETLFRFAKNYKVKVYIFNQVIGPSKVENDGEACKQMFMHLPADQTEMVHVDLPLSAPLLKSCYGFMSMFVATRLHSGIFALGSGVPAFFIGYNTKSLGVLEDMGLEDWLLELKDFEGEKFYHQLELFWQNRVANQEKIRPLVHRYKHEIDTVGMLIKQDYDQIFQHKNNSTH